MSTNSTANQHIIDRFERAISGQNGSFQQAREDIGTLKLGFAVIERDVGKLTSNVDKLVAKLEDNKKLNWPVVAICLGALPFIIGGMTFAISSFTTAGVAPVAQLVATNAEAIRRLTESEHTVEGLAIASTQADVNSKTDRSLLNERMALAETRAASEEAARRTDVAKIKSSMSQVEGQFHALSNLDNIRSSQQERLNSMMWEKSHPGEHYPNITFFPTSIFHGASGSSD